MLIDLLLGKMKLELVKKILAICVIVLIASFLGYVVETVWVAFRHGYIDNRGMHLPLLLGYGLANLFIYVLFGAPGNPKTSVPASVQATDLSEFLWYFGTIFVFISIAEALFGYAVHYISGVEWWNYNALPLHIGQYTSVPTSIGFTICICTFLDKIFVPLLNYLTSVDLLQYAEGILILSILAVLDCLNALIYMKRHKKIYTSFHWKPGRSVLVDYFRLRS